LNVKADNKLFLLKVYCNTMSLALGITLSFVAAIAWGSAMVIFKVGVKKVEPIIATYMKGVIAVPLLVLLGWGIYGIDSLVRIFYYPSWIWLILAVITITLGDFFSLVALTKINVSIAQPISSAYPFFTTLLLLIGNIEEITWNIIVGTILISIGVMTISYFSSKDYNKDNEKLADMNETENKEEKKKRTPMFMGILFSILAAIFWAGTVVSTRLILNDVEVDVVSMMGIRNGLMVIVVFVIVIFRSLVNKERKIAEINPFTKEGSFLMVGGAIAWCCGGVSFFTAVKMIGAGICTPLSSISPFIVVLLGVIFLKEKISYKQIIGVIIIIVGSILLSLS